MPDWLVIVAEDMYDDSRLISTILNHYGVEVETACNGQECLDLLAQFTPTFVITDLAMPEKDGWQLLDTMRANPDWADIPVVAVTAYHSAEVAEEVYQSGFDGYFPKPIDPARFIDQLREIIES